MNGQPFRLASGGAVDRGKPLRFRFDGQSFEGLAGDTLASALLANGVRVVGRSFRLHRPRGLIGAGVEESNGLVQLGRGAASEPNLKATQIALFDGLNARAVNAWPSARLDLAAPLAWLRRFIGPGFYYKTFIWPHWNVYSGLIRRLGGLGVAPKAPDESAYAHAFAHCDILVIGGGPTGVSAALTVAESGARVLLVDDQPELGGALLNMQERIGGEDARAWLADSLSRLGRFMNVRIMTRTTAIGWYDHNLISLVQMIGDQSGGGEPPALRQRYIEVRARRVIVASGALERPLVFANNDRPNVMLSSAARTYAVRYGVAAGRRALIATNNDSAYAAARDLLDAGMEIAALVDLRENVDAALIRMLEHYRVPVMVGHAPIDVRGTPAVGAVRVAPVSERGRADLSRAQWIDCDLVCMSGGWTPTVHLFSQSGGRLAFDETRRAFVPEAWAQKGVAAGAASGALTTAEALSMGESAAVATLQALGLRAPDVRHAPSPLVLPPQHATKFWEIVGEEDKPAWVDFQNDVTSEDIRAAAAENYRSIEHLKRYTTLGMALDQGKTSNVNGIGILSEALDKPIAQIGTTRFRPPYVPITLGALVGPRLRARYHVLRRLPTHAAQVEAGARLEDYGGWLRPAFYARGAGDEETAVRREALHVRQALGVFDASPLGKIAVKGRDAGVLLDRLYVGGMSTLAVGRCRYGLMLNEHGAMLDDGVVTRLSDELFLVGTTSGNAGRIALWLAEWAQCEWPDLDLTIESETAQWGTITIAGPHAGRLLAKLAPDADYSDAALAHMACRTGTVGGAPARIARVSYSGERSYEISVPADRADALWRACLDLGAEWGAAPFGIEALMRLRLEKGFLHVGADTAADTYPQDVGFGRPVETKKSDFVGRRSAMRANGAARRQLVGIAPLASAASVPMGSHVLSARGKASEGWVTSSGYSPSLGRWTALALVENGESRHGEEITLFDRGREVRARLCAPCAYDPEGARLHA